MAFGLAGFLLQCGACDGATETASAPADGGTQTDGRAASRTDAASVLVPPRPSDVPAGWELYTDYDPQCGFYIATERKYLPEPIRWASCDELGGDAGLPGPDTIACRHMVLDWEPQPTGQHVAPFIPAWKTPQGTIALYLRRLVGKHAYDLVADVDGPVSSAVYESGPCLTELSHARDGKVLHRVRDNPYDSEDQSGGAFGGAADALRPTVYFPKGHRPAPYVSAEYRVGANMFVENSGAARVYAFDTGALVTTILSAPEDADDVYGDYQFQGDDLFFNGNSAHRTIIKVRTAAAGMQTLIGHGADYSRAAISFGTDGVDMVWTEASERVDLTRQSYPRVETWTAKYATSPSVVASTMRRLRSEYPSSYAERNVVGCGYAAHIVYPPSTWGKAGLRLVRLSDGTSWELASESEPQKYAFSLQRPLAITCDELFALGSTLSHVEVVRIRIDSLGPGVPAD